jgi:hypothetical protein
VVRQRGFYIRRKWNKVSSLVFCSVNPCIEEGLEEKRVPICVTDQEMDPTRQAAEKEMQPFPCHGVPGNQASTVPHEVICW